MTSKFRPLLSDSSSPIGGAPLSLKSSVSDRENGVAYFLDSRREESIAYLWRLEKTHMQWRYIPLLYMKENILAKSSKSFPYRSQASITLLGPPESRQLLVFGGKDVDGVDTNDFFCINPKHGLWDTLTFQGENVTPCASSSIVLVGDKLFVFGGRASGKWLQSYSMAVFKPQPNPGFTWKTRHCPLPASLTWKTPPDAVHAANLGGGKLLVMGISVNSAGVKPSTGDAFRFDTATATFEEDPLADGHGKLPASYQRYMTVARGPNEVLFWGVNPPTLDLKLQQNELWSYRAGTGPEDLARWKRLNHAKFQADITIEDMFILNDGVFGVATFRKGAEYIYCDLTPYLDVLHDV